MKPILMIHEICEDIFNLPLENYTLTFDDGLYSQYYYYPRFQNILTEKIFFISSNIICNGKQSKEFPSCSIAHKKAFSGNKEDYMTLDQIKELIKDPLVSIGGHSHSHIRLDNFLKITEKLSYIKKDTELMIGWFQSNLGFIPTKFCFPYNDEGFNGIYKKVLGQYGFTDFYGRGRIPIEKLLHTEYPPNILDT